MSHNLKASDGKTSQQGTNGFKDPQALITSRESGNLTGHELHGTLGPAPGCRLLAVLPRGAWCKREQRSLGESPGAPRSRVGGGWRGSVAESTAWADGKRAGATAREGSAQAAVRRVLCRTCRPQPGCSVLLQQLQNPRKQASG